MKEYGFHIIAFVCIVSLFVTACDKTIHQYPESEKTWVMVELNADRTPPVYYKELTYDAEGESSINDLEPVLSGNYTADERLCLRFVVELYKMPGATDDANKGNLVERREISVERLTDAPQDTLYFCLADGNYKVLAWADYVPKEEPADWHFSTDKLDAVRANVSHKPLDNHHKNSAAGNCDFIKKRSAVDDLHIKIIYKQYVSVGYNVGTEMPNAFVETRTMETAPTTLTDDGTLLLAYDYVLASDRREDHVLVDVFVYDGNGKEINHYQNIDVPLYRNRETVIKGPFLTKTIGSGDIGIDDDFDNEHVVVIPD